MAPAATPEAGAMPVSSSVWEQEEEDTPFQGGRKGSRMARIAR